MFFNSYQLYTEANLFEFEKTFATNISPYPVSTLNNEKYFICIIGWIDSLQDTTQTYADIVQDALDTYGDNDFYFHLKGDFQLIIFNKKSRDLWCIQSPNAPFKLY